MAENVKLSVIEKRTIENFFEVGIIEAWSYFENVILQGQSKPFTEILI